MARQTAWVLRVREQRITARITNDELFIDIDDGSFGGFENVARNFRLKAADVCNGDTVTLGGVTIEIATHELEV